MEGIREILRQGTGMHADADPKRRFMHALANAALEQNDKVGIRMLPASLCQPVNGRPVSHATFFCAHVISQRGG